MTVFCSEANGNLMMHQGRACTFVFFPLDCSRSYPHQVSFGGKVVGESAIQFEEQIGLPVIHKFEVCQKPFPFARMHHTLHTVTVASIINSLKK